jgi:transcriptional regulator of acetoin/glycerol metabolism
VRIDDTVDQSTSRGLKRADRPDAVPGMIEVYAEDEPAFVVRAVDRPISIGRGDECDVVIDDRRASRRHAEVRFDDGAWRVVDFASRNGTFVDTERVAGAVTTDGDAVLAIGNHVFLLVDDVRPLAAGVEIRDGAVLGPRLRAVWDTIAKLASRGALHILGETGSGKELLARRFHAVRCPRAPFVAVNCAAVPPLLAERLFFGARRGAYSGADADADGYLAAAHTGVAFLDEIGELSLEVQAKLLRAIEAREVVPLGATKPQPIDLAIVTATHVDLRAAVADGKFRNDLYFRIANPSIALAPLRERREDIPWLIAAALGDRARAHASFVEAALVRPWPGNVRELLGVVATARDLLPQREKQLKMAHLPAQAGVWLAAPGSDDEAAATGQGTPAILDALRAAQGNVARTARALGIHRNQLRRWIERNQIDVRRFKPGLLDDRGD